METIEVGKEFFDEFNRLKRDFSWAYSAMEHIYTQNILNNPLWVFLFDNGSIMDNENQATFVKAWIGEIKFVKKEERYVVWVKGSKTEKGWANFMVVEDYVNVIDINYDNRFDMAKEDSSFHFSKEDAFKLRDTGFFEIEEV